MGTKILVTEGSPLGCQLATPLSLSGGALGQAREQSTSPGRLSSVGLPRHPPCHCCRTSLGFSAGLTWNPSGKEPPEPHSVPTFRVGKQQAWPARFCPAPALPIQPQGPSPVCNFESSLFALCYVFQGLQLHFAGRSRETNRSHHVCT